VSVDETQHVAFPKLFGAPAYARPPAPADGTERPFDPDDLPLVAELTPEERAQLGPAELAARINALDRAGQWTVTSAGYLPAGSTGQAPGAHGSDQGQLHARPFALRALADRLRGRDRSRS
jgi:hypothetical protein